jgi:hypothetical protein
MGPYVLVLMFVGFGCLFTFLGYSNVKSVRMKRATWLALTGSVVDFVESEGDKGKTLYAAVYRYTVNGTEYTARSATASSPPGYKVGDTINLVVNPAQLWDSEVIDSNTTVFSWGVLGMGLLALAAGVVVAWFVITGQMKPS